MSILSQAIDMQPVTPIRILMVEDNEGDIELALDAFNESRITNQIHVVTDGEAALEYLFRRGKYVSAPPPDIVLLDINLPRVSGSEVLHAVKQSDQLRHIPVVMLTSSDAERDVLSSYQNYANCYITKPVDVFKFLEVVRTVEDFWLSIVKLPRLTQPQSATA